MHDLAPYLRPNAFVDSDHPSVVAYANEHAAADVPQVEQAVSLYYAIRDGFRYSPWDVQTTPEGFKASGVLLRPRGRGRHCIDKAILLAACCRSLGIPSRLHFANVRNHIGTEELEQQLGTDLLVFHGYTELFLEGRWVAATPAFNKELCERLGVAPLEFDGRSDSIFQEYDHRAGRFMEYVTDHGHHPGIPFEQMIAAWREHYPKFMALGRWPEPGEGPVGA